MNKEIFFLVIILIFINSVKSQQYELPLIDIKDAVNGDYVVARIINEPESLIPILGSDPVQEQIDSYIYESLNDVDKETYEQIPGLAELPEISNDGLTYTFKMKKNRTFSDREPITGEDVIFTFKTVKNPLIYTMGLRDYIEPVKFVELVNNDKYTIKITLNKPNWRAMHLISNLQILPQHIFDPNDYTGRIDWNVLKDSSSAVNDKYSKKLAEFFNSEEVYLKNEFVIGSGPYMLEKWDMGDKITLKRNEKYNGSRSSYPDKIIFKYIQDNSFALVQAMNKEIDVMYVIPPSDFYVNFTEPEKFNFVKNEPAEPSYTYLGWNELNPIFADKKVRKALTYLVDRNSLIKNMLFGGAITIQSPVFYKNEKYINIELKEIEFDPEKAKELLFEAGWIDTDNNGILDKIIEGKNTEFKFTFLLNENPIRKKIIDALKVPFKEAGILFEIKTVPWDQYLDRTTTHEFDATYGAWTVPPMYVDPYNIFHSSQSEGFGSNFISFKNDMNDRMIEEYRNENDEVKRIEILKKWQELIYDEQPYTFLWSTKGRYINDTRFKNVRWYSDSFSPSFNEWWVPKDKQKYK